MDSVVRFIVAALIGSCSPAEPHTCTTGLDLDALARDHKAAWSAAFDGRPLLDSELIALADGQAVLECLAQHGSRAAHDLELDP
jgi:hypothetical protein